MHLNDYQLIIFRACKIHSKIRWNEFVVLWKEKLNSTKGSSLNMLKNQEK